MDSFPAGVSAAYRRFWLAESVAILKAQERIESGGVSLEDIYDLALLAYGSEDIASDLKVAKMKALNLAKSRGEA